MLGKEKLVANFDIISNTLRNWSFGCEKKKAAFVHNMWRDFQWNISLIF